MFIFRSEFGDYWTADEITEEELAASNDGILEIIEVVNDNKAMMHWEDEKWKDIEERNRY